MKTNDIKVIEYLKTELNISEDFIDDFIDDMLKYYAISQHKSVHEYIDKLGAILEIILPWRRSLTNMDVIFYRGLTKMKLQDYSGAIDDFNKAIELDPFEAHCFSVYDYGIKVYELLNDYDNARKMKERKLFIEQKYGEKITF